MFTETVIPVGTSNQTMEPTNIMFDVRCMMFEVATVAGWLICLTYDLPSSLVLSLPLKNRYLAAFPSTPRLLSPRYSPSRAIPSIVDGSVL
jgi:hypothetical protein